MMPRHRWHLLDTGQPLPKGGHTLLTIQHLGAMLYLLEQQCRSRGRPCPLLALAVSRYLSPFLTADSYLDLMDEMVRLILNVALPCVSHQSFR